MAKSNQFVCRTFFKICIDILGEPPIRRPIAKLPEEPLKPVPPSLPPSSQKPPTCFPAPVRGKSWKIFEPGHILMLVKQLSISNLGHPDTSPP